jgi:hypothetical protein
MHDLNGGIQPTGLFWVFEVGSGDFEIEDDERSASLRVSNVPVVETFQFGGSTNVPAIVSYSMDWRATGPVVARGKGTAVPATDPAAFLGKFAPASVRGSFSGRELGFSFKSDRGVSANGGYALVGRERNGVFLS